MKGIRCCGECANYSYKKHACTICTDEGKPTDSFYADCPLPDVVERVRGEWIERQIKLNWCEDDVDIIYECSECASNNYGETPFCPNCGCQMVDEVKK